MLMLIKGNNSLIKVFSNQLAFYLHIKLHFHWEKNQRHNYLIILIQTFRNGLEMEFSSQWNNKEGVENVIFIVLTSKHFTVFS